MLAAGVVCMFVGDGNALLRLGDDQTQVPPCSCVNQSDHQCLAIARQQPSGLGLFCLHAVLCKSGIQGGRVGEGDLLQQPGNQPLHKLNM